MKLEYPLSGLIESCETICVAECCGIDAYDLSPIHLASSLVASCLIWPSRTLDSAQIRRIRGQIDALKANYGTLAASAAGVILSDMNQIFTSEQVDQFADELSHNLEVALTLIEQSERLRFESAGLSDA